MTPTERKTLLNELSSSKARNPRSSSSASTGTIWTPKDVDETTQDYTNTITPDFCLHLSHRNKNRKTDYFSEAQLQIFRECAQSK